MQLKHYKVTQPLQMRNWRNLEKISSEALSYLVHLIKSEEYLEISILLTILFLSLLKFQE